MTVPDVVVVGAGMAGLAATRYLASEGFDVLTLEAHDDLGGQWNHANPRSGVWPQMRTNTASFLTRFSGMEFPPGTPVFPRNQEVLAMLRAYVERHGLAPGLRFGAVVDGVERVGDAYRVSWTHEGASHTATVPRVVVATGRYNRPSAVPVDGLDAFRGRGGVSHAFDYAGPEAFRDQRVVVLGGSISALEVACDLALGGARDVHLAQRRQRYVMPKMVTGTVIESFVFTRGEAVALATTPVEELRAATAARVLQLAGNPADYGAPAPNADIELAGVAGSPHYLNLVAEDRISVHPWPTAVGATSVSFGAESLDEVDAIVAATGFDLDLPFLSAGIRETLGHTPQGLALADFTFHPDLPGLALAGLWSQLGPYAVPLEQQARWIAYTWSGRLPAPDPGSLRAAVATGQEEGHTVGYREQHEMALRFARLAGVDPDGVTHPLPDPVLGEVLPRSAMSADVFRLVGPDADPSAVDRVLADFRRFATPAAREQVTA